MGCDQLVALPLSTGACTVVGANIHRPPEEILSIERIAGRMYAPGETLRLQAAAIPQVRQTISMVGVRVAQGIGFHFGVNEHHVTACSSRWQGMGRAERTGLLGPELVQLALQRAHHARQAVDVIGELIARHGQAMNPADAGGSGSDNIFLLADPVEAFVLEAAGQVWAAQQVTQVRAVSDVAVIRQDWCRLAPGAAERAIADKRWADDGSKLDFLDAFGSDPSGKASALRRWGRATLLLEQQNGRIEPASMRFVLSDHYSGTSYEARDARASVTPICQHAAHGHGYETAVSVVARLPARSAGPMVLWAGFGPPCMALFFPLLPVGDLPAAFAGAAPGPIVAARRLSALADEDRDLRALVRSGYTQLQNRFDQDVDDFLAEEATLRGPYNALQLQHLATSLMQSHVERFADFWSECAGVSKTSTLIGSATGSSFRL
jgi:secernin